MSSSPDHGPAHPGQLHIAVRASERRHVIVLEGELDLASAPFLTTASEAVVPRANAVVLDLDRLSFVDSSGLVAVLACAERCRRQGVGFAVTEGSPEVRRLFEIAGVAARLPLAGRRQRAPRLSGARRRHLEESVRAEARRLRRGHHGRPHAI